MNTIGIVAAWLGGSALGLTVLGLYPLGLEAWPGVALLAMALALALLALLARGETRTIWTFLLVAAALAGCGRAMLSRGPVTARDLAFFNGGGSREVVVIGRVAAEPALGDRSRRVRIAAEEIRLPGEVGSRPIKDDLLALLPRYPALNYGERVSLAGSLTAPPKSTEFDYPAYLARQGVYSYMLFPKATTIRTGDVEFLGAAVASARSDVRRALQASVPEPQAALAVGVVTGDRSSLPEDVEEAFRRSGTTHVLAISGQNIALIVGFVWLVYNRRGAHRRMPTWLTLLLLAGIALYTAFTGASPAVLRAAFMAAILLLAPTFGRRYDPVASVAIPAFLMTVWDPDVLFDIGFQLSFGAMLGLALVAPALVALLGRFKVPTLLAFPLGGSLGAQAATFPLISLFSENVSLISPLATLTIDFALLPLMTTGIVTGILGALVPGAGALTGPLVWLCGAWMQWWVEFWSALPFAVVDLGGARPAWVVVYYAGIGALLWLAAERPRRPALRRLLQAKWAAPLCALCASLWVAALWLLLAP